MQTPIESTYPINFRRPYVRELGTKLNRHQSVALIAMRRCGIANFLNFVLYHPQVQDNYLNGKTHIFIPIDLKDLVEISVYAFWKLTIKRINDAILKADVSDEIKKQSQRMLEESFQLQDLMITQDNIKSMLNLLINADKYPALFYVHFDRLQPVFTQEFFDNLENLTSATHHKASIVTTSYRPLVELVPHGVSRSSLRLFAKELYIPPIVDPCANMIVSTYQQRYGIVLDKKLVNSLIHLCGGHVQYLQLAIIMLKDLGRQPNSVKELQKLLAVNDEIQLQSEELFSSLTDREQEIVLQIAKEDNYKVDDKELVYLKKTGLLTKQNQLTNPLFTVYLRGLKKQITNQTDLTRKEHVLFNLFHKYLDQVVERNHIIETVWPDQIQIGVSDWAVDRLIARLRAKLVANDSPYEIETVITRGYRMKDRE